MINEYCAQTAAVGAGGGNAQYFELVVLKEGLDIRGLRVTNNPLEPTGKFAATSTGPVYIFQDTAAFTNLPYGCVIGVWTTGSSGKTGPAMERCTKDSLKMVIYADITPLISISKDGISTLASLVWVASQGALTLYTPDPATSTSAGSPTLLGVVQWSDTGSFTSVPVGVPRVALSYRCGSSFGRTAAEIRESATWRILNGAGGTIGLGYKPTEIAYTVGELNIDSNVPQTLCGDLRWNPVEGCELYDPNCLPDTCACNSLTYSDNNGGCAGK